MNEVDFYRKKGLIPEYIAKIKENDFQETPLIDFIKDWDITKNLMLIGKPFVGKTFALNYLVYNKILVPNRKTVNRVSFQVFNRFYDIASAYREGDFDTLFDFDFVGIDNLEFISKTQAHTLFELLTGRLEAGKATLIIFETTDPTDASGFLNIAGEGIYNFIQKHYKLVILKSLKPFNPKDILQL